MKHTRRVLAIAVTLATLLTSGSPAALAEAVPAEYEAASLSTVVEPGSSDPCDASAASEVLPEPQADAPEAADAEVGTCAGDGPVSVEVCDPAEGSGDTAARLPAPAELEITGVSDDEVHLAFSEVDGACGYALYYATDSSFNPSYSRVDADADSLTAEVDCLVPGQTYCFWVAAIDANGTVGDESDMASATTGAVSLTVEINETAVSNREILDWTIGKPLTLACASSNGNGSYLVRAYATTSEPSFDRSDLEHLATGVGSGGTGFYYGSEDGADALTEGAMEALPFDFAGCAAGQYVKIWIAAEDANHSTNGYRDSIEFALRLKNAKSNMDWSCWLTATSVKAGGMVCVKLKADRVRSFSIEIDGTDVRHSDVFDAGMRNRLASVCLRVPADTPDGAHTVTVVCSESYATNDPNAAREIRQLEFTVGALPLELNWPFHEDHTVGQHFGARDVSASASNASKGHNGIDIRANGGTKIYAAGAGTVTHSGYSGSSGNWVQIAHANGVSTVYKHLKRRSALRVGDTVEAGDLVGYVGSTGIASGNHLHFGVLLNGEPVDPLSGYITPNSVRTINFYTLK